MGNVGQERGRLSELGRAANAKRREGNALRRTFRNCVTRTHANRHFLLYKAKYPLPREARSRKVPGHPCFWGRPTFRWIYDYRIQEAIFEASDREFFPEWNHPRFDALKKG